MVKLQEIKDALFIIKEDILGWLTEAIDYFVSIKPVKLIAPTIIFLFILFEIGLTTTSQASFYLIFFKFLLAIMSSYILYRSFHQYFLSKSHDYFLNKSLKKKSLIKHIVKQMKEDGDFDKMTDAHSVFDYPSNNYELNIVYVVQFQKRSGAINAKRFIVEAIVCSCILAFIYPDLIFAAIAIVAFVSIKTSLRLDGLAYFVREEMKSLAWNIYQYNNVHPKKCKDLIAKSEYEEIRNLSTLYKYLQRTMINNKSI